jgi:[acyl-carrier-protein] S-malonyltransferase
MGSDLLQEFDAARSVFAAASTLAGYDMAELCTHDPDGRLDRTQFTQPALLTHEIACLEALRSLAPVTPQLAAGHSLGEYSALVCSGSLTFDAALALVIERGRLMGTLGRGSMLATSFDAATAQKVASRFFCEVAAFNLPDQTILAGDDADLDALTAEVARGYAGIRCTRLKTGGAFHSYLMIQAAVEYRPVLERQAYGEPAFPVLANLSGKAHASASSICASLFRQLASPVRWVECMESLLDAGIDTVIELGGGIGGGADPKNRRGNLEGLTKRAFRRRDRSLRYVAAINVAGIHEAAQLLAAD